jgi:hypothetical protein
VTHAVANGTALVTPRTTLGCASPGEIRWTVMKLQ